MKNKLFEWLEVITMAGCNLACIIAAYAVINEAEAQNGPLTFCVEMQVVEVYDPDEKGLRTVKVKDHTKDFDFWKTPTNPEVGSQIYRVYNDTLGWVTQAGPSCQIISQPALICVEGKITDSKGLNDKGEWRYVVDTGKIDGSKWWLMKESALYSSIYKIYNLGGGPVQKYATDKCQLMMSTDGYNF